MFQGVSLPQWLVGRIRWQMPKGSAFIILLPYSHNKPCSNEALQRLKRTVGASKFCYNLDIIDILR